MQTVKLEAMTQQKTSYLSAVANKNMLIVLLLGFSSGLPFALTGATLQAWLTIEKMDVSTIGLFALVGLPYTMKFIWAPLLDRYQLPLLGLRRGWGVFFQIGLCLSIIGLAFVNPTERLDVFSLLALIVAFFSASQDIVIDAYRTEIIEKENYGVAAGIYNAGYRGAAILSGGAALVMADHMTWTSVYLCMAALSLVGVLTFLLSPEPTVRRAARNVTLRQSVVAPFVEFFSRRSAMEILLFVMIYKLSTLMSVALTTKFLISLNYSLTLIGSANKVIGLTATIVGTLVGGSLMLKLGLKRSLWIFGILQAFVGVTFWALPFIAGVEGSLRDIGLIVIVGVDNFMMGLGAAAIMGFMMTVCSQQFTATQFALLASLPAVTRVILTAHAGDIVEKIGWGPFFLGTVPLAIPGLLLLTRFDQWQKASTSVTSKFGRFDLIQVSIFIFSLVALSSDPFWRWMGNKDLGQQIALAGAGGVVVVIGAGLLKPYLLRAGPPAC